MLHPYNISSSACITYNPLIHIKYKRCGEMNLSYRREKKRKGQKRVMDPFHSLITTKSNPLVLISFLNSLLISLVDDHSHSQCYPEWFTEGKTGGGREVARNSFGSGKESKIKGWITRHDTHPPTLDEGYVRNHYSRKREVESNTVCGL